MKSHHPASDATTNSRRPRYSTSKVAAGSVVPQIATTRWDQDEPAAPALPLTPADHCPSPSRAYWSRSMSSPSPSCRSALLRCRRAMLRLEPLRSGDPRRPLELRTLYGSPSPTHRASTSPRSVELAKAASRIRDSGRAKRASTRQLGMLSRSVSPELVLGRYLC